MKSKVRFVAVALLAVLATSCVSSEQYDGATKEVENQDTVIARLKEENARLRARLAELENQYNLAQLELARLRDADKLRQELADALENLKKNMNPNITVVQRSEGPAFSLENSLLFKLGSEEISDQGKALLREVADKLKTIPNKIRVDGHTDNNPVIVRAKDFPKGNLELSGARSLNVADFLIGECGLERSRMSFAGHGAEVPVADNGTKDGQAKNRRVEILILNQSN